jgi:flagellar basal-body rod modification protein FlgD
MTTVSNVISGLASSVTSSTTTTKKSGALGQDEFMTMLLAQLKNQDPLNPMDGKDFAAQLAQFSSLQQLSNLNTTMSSLPTYLKAFSNTQMVSMIGNDVVAKGNVINVNGSTTNVSFSLPSDIASGTINIYNASGSQVGTADLGNLKSGTNSITWDTSSVAAGNYTFDITAKDASGKAVTAEALISGKVTGASFKNDTAYLTINGQDVAFSNVVAINKSTN